LTTELVETGEKRDRIGRKITPAQWRAELGAAWQNSGLTQAEFARREGVIYSSFAAWVQAERSGRSRPGRAKARTAGVRFVEAKLPAVAAGPASVLEVRLGDGTIMRGSHAVEVAALVRALRR
jgi:hypothetical protein